MWFREKDRGGVGEMVGGGGDIWFIKWMWGGVYGYCFKPLFFINHILSRYKYYLNNLI